MTGLHARFTRRRPAPVPRASQVDIAVLEHDLYNVQPEPGSMASAFLGLRALANAGTGSREMMHGMSDCTATGTITLDGHEVAVICNRTPHDPTEQHNDAVHGDWGGEEQQ